MALATLRPSADGTTTGWTRVPASTTFAGKIVDDPDSHDGDTSYVLSPNVSDGSMFVELDDVPGDFNPNGINSITIKAVAKKVNTPAMAVDTSDLYLTIYRADETTVITTETSVCNVTDTANYQSFSRTVTVSGTHNTTDWNGARLQLRYDHITAQTIDSVNQIRITAAEIEIDYTPAVATAVQDVIGYGMIPWAR